MRELTSYELQEVSGGLHPLVWGVIGGITSNAIYEGIGGLDGISSMLESANDYLTDMAYSMGDNILANPDSHGYMD